MIRYARFWLGRHLIHIGLRVMPQGPVRAELYNLLDQWGTRMLAAITKARERT